MKTIKPKYKLEDKVLVNDIITEGRHITHAFLPGKIIEYLGITTKDYTDLNVNLHVYRIKLETEDGTFISRVGIESNIYPDPRYKNKIKVKTRRRKIIRDLPETKYRPQDIE